MIDVSELLYDPDFVDTYTVYRETGQWLQGRFVTTPTHFDITAPVQPLKPKELEMLPEADRQKGAFAFWSIDELFVTGEDKISDQIEYRGYRYKLVNVIPWNTWYKAIGVQLEAV